MSEINLEKYISSDDDSVTLAMLIMLNGAIEQQNDILAERLEVSVNEVFDMFMNNISINRDEKDSVSSKWRYIELEFESDIQERAQAKAELMQGYIAA